MDRLNKTCAVSYGPITHDCEDMPFHSKASVSETNSVKIGISSMNDSTNMCFVVIASNGHKTVRVEGKYYSSGTSNSKINGNIVLIIDHTSL